jgi:predicted  nucleic acid-binding Zn-ribbon protein
MLLAHGLQHQGQAFHEGLERDLAVKDERIGTLAQELETAKKQAEENESARKAAEEQIEKMHHDFRDYQKTKCDEHNKVVAGAQRAAHIYWDLIESVDEESEAPHDVPIVEFMEWLMNELAVMNI